MTAQCKFNNLQEYKDLVRSTKKRLNGIRTNCKLLSSYFTQPISEGRLSYEAMQNGMLVFLDEGSYQNLFYYWSKQHLLPVVKQPKLTLVEELLSSSQDGLGSHEFLVASGLSHWRTNLHYSFTLEGPEEFFADLDERIEQKTKQLHRRGIELQRCTSEEIWHHVLELWDRELSVADVPLDHRMFTVGNDGATVMVATKDGSLAGTYWWKDETRTVRSGRHIVTSKEFTRLGIASALLFSCIHDMRHTGMQRLDTWIAEDNLASIALHEKLGFMATGRIARQYLLDTSE